MPDLIIIQPFCPDTEKTLRLRKVLDIGLKDHSYINITNVKEFSAYNLRNKRIIFAISLGESGINLEYYKILKEIRLHQNCFEGSVGGVIIDGNSELYTKKIARELVFSANTSKCTFPGKPLVEGTASLNNFNIVAKNLNTNNDNAYIQSCKTLIEKVLQYRSIAIEEPKLLVIHAGNVRTSNTLALWHMVNNWLTNCDVKEISIREGQVYGCNGCSYKTCLHYGEMNQCFYGGVITEAIFPAILECDGLVMICPNYNDAIGAKLTACINRLSALYKANKFNDKRLFAVVVSGYSGSDIVAQQLVSGLCMNKNFILPPEFAITETANNPMDIKAVNDIDKKAHNFADNIMKEFHRG